MKSHQHMQNLCEIETFLVSLLEKQGPNSEIEIRMRVTDQELEKAIVCLMSRVMSRKEHNRACRLATRTFF